MIRRLLRGPERRSRQVALIVGVVVLVGGGGWFAGSRMQSPADAAAGHRPPDAGPVTVAVQRRHLTASVVTQGSVEFGAARTVALSGPVGAAGGSGGEAVAQLVTNLPKAGAKLTEGSVLMQVSGRPVFVLRGTVPMYRTLGPGVSGDDVRQLQNALRRLGHDPGGVGGHYGQGTAAAVTQWYRSKGFEPRAPGADDEKQLGDLQQAVTDAQLALLQAQGGDGGASGGTGPDAGGKDEEAASAPPASGAAHTLELKSARDRLDQANKALSAFTSAYGTKLPAGEVVFLPDLPARVDKAKVHLGDTPDGPVATVTGPDVEIRAVVPASDSEQVREGMPARIDTADGKQVTGVVTKVADAAAKPGDDKKADGAGGGTGADEEGGTGSGDPSAPVPVVVSVPHPGALKNQAGSAVTVTIGVSSSKGSVLVVPVAAVHTASDGEARVRVARDGEVVDVPVEAGLSAAGQVEVSARGGALREGDQVVVGQ
ncbi:peptidoglycan-binding protein [Streptomyces sp. NPDC093065]|uniref:peptidoglycan-binding protein n=1 Tax=Streptomyces sp. NPDC093065 TaxID=3366021 RepID=UPI003825F10B